MTSRHFVKRAASPARHLNRLVWAVFAAAVFAFASPADAGAATHEEVDAALERAKNWLYDTQREGHWELRSAPDPDAPPHFQIGGQWGGRTALAVWALLSAGESHQDERLIPAIEFLKEEEITGVYALAMRAQVWSMLPATPEIRALMERDAERLLATVRADGSARGHHDYIPGLPGRAYSHSRSQFGALGLWSAAEMGVAIPPVYWEETERAWVEHQDPSGGWTYRATDETEHPLTPGMTAAGVATLFITRTVLYPDEGVPCRGNIDHPAIDRGLEWIAGHFDLVATDERYPRDFPYATLFAVERIGVASGIKYFNGIDWYQKGAEWLIGKQWRNGSWSAGGAHVGPLPDTCFAMLFLIHGRAPVVMNKLDYSGADRPAHWNQRPRDVANLADWLGKMLERRLNWQILPLDAPLIDFHDAPILYISGNQAMSFTDDEKDKLRRFAQQGGLILGHADCAGRAFANSFRQLGRELFPQYDFRPLPDDHLIYTNHFQRDQWRRRPAVLGLSNGARELMLLLPQGDPARSWQQRNHTAPEQWELPANIFLYANDQRSLRYKDEPYWVEADPAIQPDRTIALMRLRHDGNWDPEPAGWRRLANVMHNRDRVRLEVESPDAAAAAADALADATIIHLTGTDAVELDEPTRAALKRCVESGATLIVDAAGGSAAFADSAEAMLGELFADALIEPLAPEHPLYGAGGDALELVAYRPFAQRELTGASRTPRLRGIEIDGRLAVVFSREDLSVGLVGHHVDGILGYVPDSATDLMRRILLHAAE